MREVLVCRACRGSRPPLRPLWGARKVVKGAPILCADMLAACVPNIISDKHDGFPAHICLLCYRKLCSAYKFRLLCESSYSYFVNYSAEGVKLENIKTEKFDDELHQVNNAPSLELGTEDTKAQSENMTLTDYAHIDIVSEVIDSFKSENEIANTSMDEDNDGDSPSNDFQDSCSDENEPISKKKLRKKLKKSHMKTKKKSKQITCRRSTLQSDSLMCTLCPKTFKHKYLLVAHQDSHLGIKRYFCQLCQKSYRNEKDHVNMHRRGFKFKCDLCGKCFNTKAKLSIHKEIHSEERERFPCDVQGCGKFFLSMNGLERHRLSHTGFKNFICQMCSKSFIDKYQLDLHIRIHTNDRRYACTFCDKKFITTSAKISHERWHMKTKNYVCQHCEKAFVTSSGLKRHLFCHSKELPEACRFCGKKFARFDNRKRHEMAMHHISEKTTKDTDLK